MQLTYMIDDYYRLRLTQVAEAYIDTQLHTEAPYCPADSNNNLQRDIQATAMDRRLGYQFGIDSAEDFGPLQMASAHMFTTCERRGSCPVR
jgi:hypothetical protein